MKKLNDSGFAMVEMIIVAAFIMGLLTLMYTNFYPMIGEYEKRENYDNIESVYNTYLVKKMVELRKISLINPSTTTLFNCDDVVNNDDDYCEKLVNELGIEKMYIANYANPYESTSDNDKDVSSYIETITKASSFPGNYRVIVKYKVKLNTEADSTKIIYQYSSMGVIL